MKPSCQELYRQRNQRTSSYLGKVWTPALVPQIEIGPDAASAATGQHLFLSLVNMLARLYPRLLFTLPDRPIPLVTPALVSEKTFQEGVLGTARAVDPCGNFELASGASEISIGIGDAGIGHTWYVGADQSLATLSRSPVEVMSSPGTHRGAGLAACLAASVATAEELGLPTAPTTVSAWNFLEGIDADPGPADLVPVEVGRVLMVGAGAVGSALAYWMSTWGVQGDWTVVDRDVVKLHNTNRGLLFLPSHTDWAGGIASPKVNVLAAALPGSRPVDSWYDEAPDVQNDTFDVVLALANERGVRSALGGRNQPVLLHATTGRNFVSQLHRHVPEIDDCIGCRIPADDVPVPDCSTVKVRREAGERSDAALPFLSAASGLMLAVSLQRLQAGVLASTEANGWLWYFCSPAEFAHTGRFTCSDDCATIWRRGTRRRVHGETRWFHVDPAADLADRHY